MIITTITKSLVGQKKQREKESIKYYLWCATRQVDILKVFHLFFCSSLMCFHLFLSLRALIYANMITECVDLLPFVSYNYDVEFDNTVYSFRRYGHVY